MSVFVLLGVTCLQVAAAQSPATQPPMRDPAYARDGRLAVSIDGDLWIQRSAARDAGWQRITSGPAWDREPAWTPDGSAIVFTSDRAGALDLWRVRLGANGAPSEPERITTDAADEMEPSVGADGTIVFTRGREGRARLWVRDSAGVERRLTTTDLPERWGALSPSGSEVAYVQLADAGNRLRVRGLAARAPDSVVVGDRAAEHPAWSPDGQRIAFASTSPSPGVYVTTRDGAYVNLAAAVRGAVSWSPDGATLAVAEAEGVAPGYNGDPRRLPDRVAESLGNVTRFRWVAAPAPLDASVAAATPPAIESRAARNTEMFDRIWTRIDRLYYATPAAAARHAEWERLRDANRARAIAATSDLELERVVHTDAARPVRRCARKPWGARRSPARTRSRPRPGWRCCGREGTSSMPPSPSRSR